MSVDGDVFYYPEPGTLTGKKQDAEGIVSLHAEVKTHYGVNVEVQEELQYKLGTIERQAYSYQAYNPNAKEDGTVLRYEKDWTHHKNIPTFPDHKHIGPDTVVENYATTLEDYFKELKTMESNGTLDNILKKSK